MVSAVRSRPNHYDALGLTPAASDEDIARAFAREMEAFRWHPAGAAAQLWIAYETLRDRIKRADYDRSLGLAPLRQQAWSMAVMQQQWTPFIASPAAKTADEVPRAPETQAEPQVSAPLRPDAPLDPRLESIAASIRELAKPVRSEKLADPPLPQHPARSTDADVEFVIEDIRAVARAERERLHAAEDGSFNWKRPAQIVGALIVGAGVLGAVLGMSARDSASPAQAEAAPAGANPSARLHPSAAMPPAESLLTPPFASETPDPGLFPDNPKPRHRSATRTIPQRDHASDSAAIDSQPEAAAADPAVVDPIAPQPAAAKLPLSNAVIARTIDRIGYRCGEVASTAAADGAAPGTFTVTCSSGQTYQAAPSHGRYRFRRTGH